MEGTPHILSSLPPRKPCLGFRCRRPRDYGRLLARGRTDKAAHEVLIAPVIRTALSRYGFSTNLTRPSRRWIDGFLRHSAPAAPGDLGAEHARVFLSWLAVERRVSASMQSQAWNALLFLFRFVFDR
jgi:hypothetical protein